MAESVKVIVRCRPMNGRENNLKCKSCITCDGRINKVSIFKPDDSSSPPKNFTFDGTYYTDSTTKQIYEDVGFALVDGVLEGYNGTVFAYGQTGCGKSFSMQGIPDPPEQKGIIPRSFEHIFEAIDVDEGNTNFLVQASYLEIYNEEIRDLLGKDTKQKLELRESPDTGVYTQGLTQHIVTSLGECIKLMEKGWMSRSTGATLMNAESSRSHSIFAIRIEMCDQDEDAEKIKVGKLNLVDLAGSERQGKTGATGERLREATKINLSLSALGNVISALVDGKSKHIPYRDSKLTRLLQDSLGGNTKTMMVACISPADNNYDETLSTLRYANRAKNIKNKPKINEDPKDALLREYAEEIQRLKAMLEGKMPVENVTGGIITPPESREAELREEYEEQIAQLNSKYEEEKMTKDKLNEELERIKCSYHAKLNSNESSDMAVSPFGAFDSVLATTATSPMYGDEGMQSLDIQSISSNNTPMLAPDEDNTIQFSVKQAESLTTKQLSNLVLSPAQARLLGYDGPVTAAHIACLPLKASQIMQLELSSEQRALLTQQQSYAVTTLDEQCEDLAYNQLLAYVDLLKNTDHLQLSFEQAQHLSSDQLSGLVLSKEQSKAYNGATTAQELTLEKIAGLKLTPAQVAQLRLSDDQLDELDDTQLEVANKVVELMKKQQLMCLLSDPKLQNIPTVTLTSAQTTQLDGQLVRSMPLTDLQTNIMKEYKDSCTHTDVSDLDQLPLLPHQVKHLKVQESCILDKQQTQKVGKSIETQTYVENSAIATMVDMEEGLTKTVTLTAAEAASITTEQLAKIQVAVSKQNEEVVAGVAEALTLTPLEIHQMQLSEEQRLQIKAKKLKRIDKHTKVISKLKKQTAAIVELSDCKSPEPHLVLTSEQAIQVEGSIGPTKEQQDTLQIEPGRHLDSEDLGGVVLSTGQISQLSISSESILDPQQKEAYHVAKQKLIKQDVLKRLKDTSPLSELEMTLSEEQARSLSEDQMERLSLTEEQCEILGLVPGQNVSLSELSLIALNGEQILQLKLSERQMSILSVQQKQVMNSVASSAMQELAYLNTTEEEGMLTLSLDQANMLSAEQIARLTTTHSQLALLGKDGGCVLTSEDISTLKLTKTQLRDMSLTKQQTSLLSQTQKELLKNSLDSVEHSLLLKDGATKKHDEKEKSPQKTENSVPEISFEPENSVNDSTTEVEETRTDRNGTEKATEKGTEKAAEKVTEKATEKVAEKATEKVTAEMQEQVLRKLQKLQGKVVNSGADLQVKSSKKEIREKLIRRREAAELKKRKLRQAMVQGNDEGVIEELFSLQMGEVESRDKKLSKIKDKYKEKMMEITDITEEFQAQREDYLDSIRDQSKECKLLQQLLDQIQPLLRRDSNYYNLDAIKRECQWNDETDAWFVPPIMITQTKLPAQDTVPNNQRAIQPSHMEPLDDTRIRAKLSSTASNSDYFKTTRQQRLLQENKLLQSNNGFHGNHGRQSDSLSRRNVLHPIKKNKPM